MRPNQERPVPAKQVRSEGEAAGNGTTHKNCASGSTRARLVFRPDEWVLPAPEVLTNTEGAHKSFVSTFGNAGSGGDGKFQRNRSLRAVPRRGSYHRTEQR